MRQKQIKMDESTSIEQAQHGNTRAYGLLVEKYQSRVYALVCRVCRNNAQAQEVVQDVFLKAYAQLSSFRGTASFSTWLYRIAYNTAISQVRKNTSRRKAQDAYTSQMANAPEEAYDDSTDSQYTALQQALANLNHEDRLLIELFYYKELKMEEVAYIARLSVSNAKVRLFRIRQKLLSEIPAKTE